MITLQKYSIWFTELQLRARISVGIFFLVGLYQLSSRTDGFTSGPVLCPFRALTNLPCPYCGTTRSVGNIVIGNFEQALYFNPLGYLVVLFFLAYLLAPHKIKALYREVGTKFANISKNSRISLTLALTLLPWLLNLPRLI